MREVVIVDALRTPVGRVGGALAAVRPDDLAALTIAALVKRVGLPGGDVDEVFLGCANQAGEDNRNVARMALLLAGLPVEVPGATVNRLCASGAEAIAQGARAIKVGEAAVVVAGGVESMSRAPWVVAKPDRAYPVGAPRAYDSTLGWRFVNDKLDEQYGTESMGLTAENLVEEFGLSRERQDAFALVSHQRAVAATESGRAAAEIVPVDVAGKRETVRVEVDEGPRPDTSLERLARLKPAFREGGSVTAGNSSSLNDGAAAVLLVSEEYARAHGLTPIARVGGYATAGVLPRVMGVGPVPATRKLLERTGASLNDVDHIELNEAFAAQVLAVVDSLGIDEADPRLNPNGGAIAIGHPLGCSGARLITALVTEMRLREDVVMGVATMCVGVGQGVSMLVERV